MGKIAVEITGLNHTYHDGTRALSDINLQVEKNKKIALLGANGSGKTTLLYHFNGTFLPREGQVAVMGRPVTKKNIPSIRKMVGLLFDNPDNQLFSTTVFNDIAFGPRNLKLDEREVLQRVNRAIRAVRVEELKYRAPFNLSLGQKKKVAVAGLLAMEPEVLACDEPFSGLDPCSVRQFMELFDMQVSGGATLVFSSHDVDLAYAWADGVVILKEGQVLAAGDAALLEDRALMEESRLRVPLLADLFEGSGFKPRTVEEAKANIRQGKFCQN